MIELAFKYFDAVKDSEEPLAGDILRKGSDDPTIATDPASMSTNIKDDKWGMFAIKNTSCTGQRNVWFCLDVKGTFEILGKSSTRKHLWVMGNPNHLLILESRAGPQTG